MRRRSEPSKSGLFLLEMLLAVFLFILSAAVCLWLFAAADRLDRRAEERDQALFLVQSVAEQLRGGEEALRQSQPQAVWTEEGFSLAYDAAWEPCAAAEADYLLTASLRQEGRQRRAGLRVERADTGETVFQQEFVQHLPLSRADETGGGA